MTGSTERARPEILETLTAGIAGLTSSEAWRRYLDVQRRFYRYSFANTLLISLQRPDATRVAGFHAWLKLGRAVRKGERGIAILAPCVYRARGREEAADDRPDETADRVIRGFKVVHVFDVAQTDREPLPEVARRLDSAEDYPVLDCLQAVGALLGYTLVREDLGPSTNGDCDFLARRIRRPQPGLRRPGGEDPDPRAGARGAS